MKANVTLAIVVIILLVALSLAGGWLGRGAWDRAHAPEIPPADTVWIWKRDTVRIADEKPVGTVTVKLPVVKDKNANNTNLLTDFTNKLQEDSLNVTNPLFFATSSDLIPDTTKMVAQPDSATVEIPITQRTYEGEYYRAVVQGWQPELVDIEIRWPEIATPKEESSWWSITVGFQMGYGFTPKGWQPYAGIGATIGLKIPKNFTNFVL